LRRLLTAGAGLLAGVVVGAILMLGAQSLSSMPEATGPPSIDTTTLATPVTTRPVASGEDVAPPPPISDQVLLVWTPGGLPQGFGDRLAEIRGVNAVTGVRSDLAHLVESKNVNGEVVDQPPDGWVVPIEVMAFDPATYSAFLPKRASNDFTTLGAGEIILGSTSAQLRRIGAGGVLTLEDGSSFIVTAVVDDVLIGAAEAALPVGAAGSLGIALERYLLIRYSGDRKDLESSIRAELPDGVAVRIRAPGETPVLRHGDAVLPQVLIKKQFGEFAYRPDGGLSFVIDTEWVDDSIVTSRIPLLGSVTCHRNLIPALAGAMGELEATKLDFLIDPDGFRGCFNPRYIANSKGISRHAWGAAADVNSGSNPEGLDSVQDPRLIRVMEQWGFTSGDDWLVPDPGHFEYVQPAP